MSKKTAIDKLSIKYKSSSVLYANAGPYIICLIKSITSEESSYAKHVKKFLHQDTQLIPGELLCYRSTANNPFANKLEIPIQKNAILKVYVGYSSVCAEDTDANLVCWNYKFNLNEEIIINWYFKFYNMIPIPIEIYLYSKQVVLGVQMFGCINQFDKLIVMYFDHSSYRQLSYDDFRYIDMGYKHICGLTKSGKLKCWDVNTLERVFSNHVVQTKIKLFSINTDIYYERDTICILDIYGELFCWNFWHKIISYKLSSLINDINDDIIDIHLGINTLFLKHQNKSYTYYIINLQQNEIVIPKGFEKDVTSVTCGYSNNAIINSTGNLIFWFNWPYFNTHSIKVFHENLSVSISVKYLCSISLKYSLMCKMIINPVYLHSLTVPIDYIESYSTQSVSVCSNEICAISSSYKLTCWSYTQTQINNFKFYALTYNYVPNKVKFRAKLIVSNGKYHCAIDIDYHLVCWENGNELDDAKDNNFKYYLDDYGNEYTRDYQYNYTQHQYYYKEFDIQVSSVSLGYDYFCAYVYVWVDSPNLLICYNFLTLQYLPTPDEIKVGVIEMSTGSKNACAISVNAELVCWMVFQSAGKQVYPIPHTTGIQHVSVGFNHTCIVDNQNQLHCWIHNKNNHVFY